jgi:RimJ/RimL family protein N-acetyltransferase
MKKMGFHLERTLRRQRRIAGHWIDIHQVGLLKEDFKPHW